ncbi:alpha-ketoacid dehydrogenase kinase [Fomitiporia mediterranea MF3/22]|uniref:alpha-ketoacid dehydrogenase kinase n=1 Tax=Fomitiporia mediterranea (strain MF3/22) TaxID=694068 RepID=UPI0004407D1C|nr:alpha-ketoacid dehydrogenase kinase [Fomitiporia mediterranea MF3/22]EJD01237.1 alpha-ketoacid dehydrogenase kinase [Fomitiporia mediterranea MF3/22]
MIPLSRRTTALANILRRDCTDSICCRRSSVGIRPTCSRPRFVRHASSSVSSALHFYQNRQLELYASKETKRLTLRQLIFFGRSMTEERLIMAANYVRSELPIRIAHRLRDMQALPFIVVTQEDVARVYELYWTAFDKFRAFPPITSMADNLKFCELVRSLLDEHAAIIPSLALGLSLSSHHLPPEQLDAFITRMLISRISRRVLAEHHLALTEDFIRDKNRKPKNPSSSPHVGIINTELNPRRSIERCTDLLQASPRCVLFADPERAAELECPKVVINGHVETKFAYIRDQFEYIVFELLKNAIYATSLRHPSANPLPDIRATIAAGEDEIQIRISDQGGGLVQPEISSPSDLLSFSHVKNTTRLDTSRISALKSASSRPQGIRATVHEQVEAWKGNKSINTPEQEAGVGVHTRLGIGLPMSNIFATYFGGSLELVSLDGWGTDVYLRLPKLGTKLEGIEV